MRRTLFLALLITCISAPAAFGSNGVATINQLRQGAGLPVLPVSQQATQVAATVASNNTADPAAISPDDHGIQTCDPSACSFAAVNRAYKSIGGTGTAAAWAYDPRDTANIGIDDYPLVALALDSRATGIGEAPGGSSTTTVVVITFDLSKTFTPHLLRKTVDPRALWWGGILVKTDANKGATLYETRAGTQYRAADYHTRDFDWTTTPLGTEYVGFDASANQGRLPYGKKITVALKSYTTTFATSAVQTNGGFKPGNMPARERNVILNTLAHGPRYLHVLVSQIDQKVTLFRKPNLCTEVVEFLACAVLGSFDKLGINFSRPVSDTPLNRFTIYHEFGHIVDYVSMDTPAESEFKAFFKRSGGWKNCYKQNSYSGTRSPCLSFAEIFADQFATWALSYKPRTSGYPDPNLITSRSGYERLLRKHFALRPYPVPPGVH